MSAQALKQLDERHRSRRRPARWRDRMARLFRRGTDRRRQAQLRADPRLLRDVGLQPEDLDQGGRS
ncbi:hypothetical protein [uncultured Mameliella sp.]|uniref:hypothetical protein n=1 Tax=uncultured Mameliella sp. TaxID=1447087 RepID=UPI00260C60F1|nr:hypothetical protein [uncultured Mameliella sp.]